jgi:exodeoxyribonuclease VII large subunit
MMTVSQLVAELSRAVEQAPALRSALVAGELVDAKLHPASGHWYLTLADAESRIRAVMFRQDALTLSFRPEVGQQVAMMGQVRVYRKDGAVQLYVRRMEPLGAGAEKRALEALVAKLRAEGILARPKRPLPLLPRAVGVVTSRDGAAVHDIISVAGRRFPGLTLVVAPTAVQGEAAPGQIAAALRRVVQHPRVDVVILARGGGSQEDLSAFNDERVVRAVAACPRPVVSAVGHDIDTTLVDLVSDLRAPTPSAAAEVVVPERGQLRGSLAQLTGRMVRVVAGRIERHRGQLRAYVDHGVLKSPERLVADRRVALDRLSDRAADRFRRLVERRRLRVAELASLVAGLDPTAVLARGFALVTDAGNRPVTAAGIAAGQDLAVRWADGRWAVTSREPLALDAVALPSAGAAPGRQGGRHGDQQDG